MRKKNGKQTCGSARYSMLFRSSLVTFSSLRSRLSESALLCRCRVFSLRLTWKKTPRTSSSSQSGYKTAKKVEVPCVCVCVKVTEIVTCFDLFTVKGKKRKAENVQEEEEEEEEAAAPAEEEQAQTSQQAADDSDSDSDDSSHDEK